VTATLSEASAWIVTVDVRAAVAPFAGLVALPASNGRPGPAA
jgi:hypothetical protein